MKKATPRKMQPTDALASGSVRTSLALAKPRKKAMEYVYSDNPPEPTGKQNIFVLKQLRSHPHGLTTVELVELGVADPRPRIRDLRELGHRIDTIQLDPNTVGRYILFSGKLVAA